MFDLHNLLGLGGLSLLLLALITVNARQSRPRVVVVEKRVKPHVRTR